METALIPAGSFTMGDDGGRPDERPPHRVYLDAFRMAATPVTNGAYRRFLDATGRGQPRFWDDARFNAPDQPVVAATWFDAVAYCDWLSDITGGRWRLPTEAERERAMRGGVEGRSYPWGDDPGAGGCFEQDAPRAVALSEPNGYGLYDIAYNIHEWCSDWYDARCYASSPPLNPTGPETGTRRASRGGAWRHQVKVCRNAARSSLDPTFQYNDYGFRVVMEIARDG